MFSIPPIDLSHGAYNPAGDVNALNVMMLSMLEDEDKKKKQEEIKKPEYRRVNGIDETDLKEHLWQI